MSDNDFYCTYTDTAVIPSEHIPMGIKVIQSSFVWDDSIADGIQIIEYKVINTSTKSIDSMFIGFLMNSPSFWGVTLLADIRSIYASYSGDSVRLLVSPLWWSSEPARLTFQWFPGSGGPTNDNSRYALLSSGVIDPDEFPVHPDARFISSWGPFTLPARTDPSPDTLILALGIVCGGPSHVFERREIARQLYLSGGVTSVENPEQLHPKTFQLHQNYPNPFNPETNIKFQIPSSNFVSLEVFNILGQKVQTLVNEKREAGEHSVQFDATGLPSGVYVYRLRAGEFSKSRKMILVR